MRKRIRRRFLIGKRGQTTVEYLLTTLTLVTVFAGMFGMLQSSLTKLFTSAGIKILTPYCASDVCH
jgi:Flp pilus assembly pilin Flp